MKRSAPEPGPRPLPLTQAEVPSQTQQRHVEGSSNQGSLIEVVMPLAPVVPQGALPGAQAVQPLPMPVIDVPLMPAAVPMADAPPLVLTSAQLLALPFGGVLQPPVLQAPPAIHSAEEHGPVEPGASKPLRNHPHIQLETGKYYRFKDDDRLYELHWSRHPQLWCDGERAVDLERVPGAVQLLGAMIAIRRYMRGKLLARDTYAQFVLRRNGTSYSTLPDAFDALLDTFSESAFLMKGREDIAFVRRVQGPFGARKDMPSESTGTQAADQQGDTSLLTATTHIPPVDDLNNGVIDGVNEPEAQGAFSPDVYWAAESPPDSPDHPGSDYPQAVTSAQLLFATGQPAVGAAPFPASAPLAPLQPAGVPSPRTADSEMVEWPAEYVDELRGLLLTAIQSADEETVLFCLRVRGVCDDEVLRQAKESAFGSRSIASERIRAAVERVYGAGTSNTNTG